MTGMREQGRPFMPEQAVRFRRFGLLGPVYEIEAVKDEVAQIRVLESGELLDYPIDRVNQDPAA